MCHWSYSKKDFTKCYHPYNSKKNIKLNSDEWKNKKTIQNPKKHDAATLKVCLKNNEVVREVLVFKKPTNNNLGDFKCYHLKRISTLYNFT